MLLIPGEDASINDFSLCRLRPTPREKCRSSADHWSTTNYFPWQEWGLLDADLYQQDKVKGVGLSNYGPKRLQQVYKRFSDRGIPITTLQVQYSLLSTYPVTELCLKEICDELGIKLIAYSPLALGILTGKYS